MKTLLQTQHQLCSPIGGQSTQLADRFVAAMARCKPGRESRCRVISGREPVPHLTAERFGAFVAAAEARTAEQGAVAAVLRCADRRAACARSVIVIGLPMYNFGVPSSLKAYFDHIARAGVDLPLHGAGPGGPADRQEGVRVRDPRRRVRRNAARHAD